MKSKVSVQDICVCIPVYNENMSIDDKVSLDQCFDVLKSYRIFLFAPYKLELSDYFERYSISENAVKRFDDKYFSGPESYSELLLDFRFYDTFSTFNYMLIYQTDAFVFKDELLEWANKGFDYIGAPWYGAYFPNSLEFREGLPIWRSNLRLRKIISEPSRMVGNGGFSLRNIKSASKNLKRFKRHLEKWHCRDYEDTFFSIALPNLNPFYKIPDESLAKEFSLELSAKEKIHEMKKLPFGAHAWKKHDLELYDKYIINFELDQEV